MSSRRSAQVLMLVLAMLLVSVTSVLAYGLYEPTTTWNVTPISKTFPGDRACPVGSTLVQDQFQSVTEGIGDGSASATYTIDGQSVTVNLTIYADNSFDFEVVGGVMPQMFVKGGAGSGYLLYQYEPPVAGATNTGPVSSDTGLHDGYVSGASYQDVSHLDFCLTPVYPLRAEKTAAGSYDETWTWTLQKTVDPDQSEFAGNALNDWTWTVTVGESFVNENFAVTGDITIYNDNGFAVPFTVSDVLNDGTAAVVSCPDTEVPADGSIICTYTASPANASATLNTATVTSGNPAVEGAAATAPVSFEKNVVNGTATVTDDEIGLNESLTAGDGGTRQWTATEGATCSSNPAEYAVDGKYSVTDDNTALLTSNGGQNLQADAETTYTCYAPIVTKDASASYDETWTWTLQKTVDPDQSEFAGNALNDWTWTVTVGESSVDENFAVSGTIYVNNPAGSPGDMTVSLVDQLNDGTLATVDCGSGATSVTVATGAQGTCSYTASPANASATLNTATGTFNGISGFVGTAPVSFEKTVVNGTATVDDDQEPDFPVNLVAGDGGTRVWTETQDHTCSTDWTDYGADGKYSDTLYNTATLTSNGGQNLEANADTTYTCEAGTVDVQKYTDGVVNAAYDWQFALFIGPDGFGGTQVGNTSSALNDADGILDFGDPIPALRPDTTYTVCELNVAAGWATEWSIGGMTVIPYNPNADDVPSEDLGNDCFDVGAGTSYPVTVGQNLRITVDNTFPGGDPRTPGYWKNWNSCTAGGQYAKTTDDVDPDNEFVSLDEVLNSPGVSWGDFTIDSCELAVSILDQRDFNTGKKMASDAAYTLAMHLLAAQLNYGAGAEQCAAASTAIVDAENLLVSIGFDATGSYLRPKNALYQTALDLAYTLDQYNNGYLCTP